MDDLYKLGADEVIPEEIETSVKIFSSVMARFLVPREEISRFESMLRAKGYELLLSDDRRKNLIGDTESEMPDVEIASFRIQENSYMAGKSIQDSALRAKYELNVLAIKRGEAFLLSPDAEMVMVPGDLVVVFGRNESISSAAAAFRKLQPGDGDLGVF
jgi:CPA2 family monovalent cation:H+ antiporter-2